MKLSPIFTAQAEALNIKFNKTEKIKLEWAVCWTGVEDRL